MPTEKSTINDGDVEEQIERLNRMLSWTHIPEHEEERLYSEIRDVIREYRRRRAPGAYSSFISGYVSREYARRQRGDRDSPLCRCSDPLCSLSKGELPPQLRSSSSKHFESESFETRVSRFVEDYPHATVIREAQSRWEQRGAWMLRKLQSTIREVAEYRSQQHRSRYDEGNIPG